MNVEQVPVGELTEHPANPRQGDVGAITESIRLNGWYGTLVAQTSSRQVLVGNHRLQAARVLEMETVPVMWIDVDDDRALRILLADNRTSDLASYDDRALAGLLMDLAQATEAALEGTIYDGDFLDDLIHGHAIKDWADARETDRRTSPTKPAISETGDLWVCGRHRVLCGDALDAGAHEILRAGDAIQFIYVDPPYGMNLNTSHVGGHPDASSYDPVEGDDQPFDPGPVLALYENVREQVWWGADYYRARLPDGGSWFVWDKRSEEAEIGAYDAVRGAQFELAWTAKAHRRILIRERWSGLIGVHSEGEVHRRVHPTQKPVQLHRRVFDLVGAEKRVLDCYAGSGSTMIACEVTARTAYLIEMDGHYVDTICRRYREFTGNDPVKEGSGEVFPADPE